MQTGRLVSKPDAKRAILRILADIAGCFIVRGKVSKTSFFNICPNRLKCSTIFFSPQNQRIKVNSCHSRWPCYAVSMKTTLGHHVRARWAPPGIMPSELVPKTSISASATIITDTEWNLSPSSIKLVVPPARTVSVSLAYDLDILQLPSAKFIKI